MLPSYSCGWDIVHSCGYRCPYCFFIPSWTTQREETERRHEACSRQDWLSFWRRLADRYGPFRIEVAGGEPFCHPDFEFLIREVSKLHRVLIVTNLSADLGRIIGVFDPEAVGFSASFHPLSTGFPEFTAKLLGLREAGFQVRPSLVAYPPFLDRLTEWSDGFRKAGFDCYINPFQGPFADKLYPQAYTAEESRLLDRLLSPERQSYRMRTASPRGRPCAAGQKHFRLWPDGTAYRCCSATEVGESPLGRIQDADFALSREARPCPSDRCFAPNELAQLL